MNRKTMIILTPFLLGMVSSLSVTSVGAGEELFTFEPDTVIKSSDVNHNFEALNKAPTIVTSTVHIAPGDTETDVAKCVAGKYVTGGGCTLSGGSGHNALDNAPDGVDGWKCRGSASIYTVTGITMTTYAICR